MKVKIKKLHPDAVIPTYGTEGSACFDLSAIDCKRTVVFYGDPKTFRTGLSFEIPEGHVMMVYSRSGMGFKQDTRLSNCVGVIDSDYRGEVMVRLTNDCNITDTPKVAPGDRIAQAMIIPVQQCSFVEVDDLSDTERGTGGFGSTGS